MIGFIPDTPAVKSKPGRRTARGRARGRGRSRATASSKASSSKVRPEDKGNRNQTPEAEEPTNPLGDGLAQGQTNTEAAPAVPAQGQAVQDNNEAAAAVLALSAGPRITWRLVW